MASPKKNLKSLKTSVFSRGLSLAKFGLNAGVKYAGAKVAQKSNDEVLIEQTALMAKEFGRLKGTVMKAGQMLSMYGEFFLPPAANQFLKSLQSDTVSVEWSIVRETLAHELGEELLAELVIDPNPIGTASLGQVHPAVIEKTGEKIAIKIQYPGIENAIDSDLASLKVMLKVARVLPDSLDLDPVFREVKSMLHQELDYTREAKLTELYKEKLKDDSRFVVPNVYKRYSTKSVLTTTYLEGFRADHNLIQSLNQSRRNRLAENFLDLYLKEIFDWNLVQTDPHLGNYKIQIDAHGQDKIVLLDFGACTEFSKHFISHYRKLVQGSVQGDRKLFLKGAQGLGFIIDSDPKDYIEAFITFCDETVEPFWSFTDPRNRINERIDENGFYHWKETNLPHRVLQRALQFRKFDLRTPPQEIIFIDRKTAGVFIFLSVLKAHLNARKVIDPYFKSSYE